MRALATLVLSVAIASAVAAAGQDPTPRLVKGARRCGHYFRDTLFVVPRDRRFTLTGIGVDFSRDRARLPDSMYVAVMVTNARLYTRQDVRFRRGPHVGPAVRMMERFPGRVTYAPGETLVVSLHHMHELYWTLEGWPRHTLRWEGYFTRVGVTGEGPRP